MSLRQQLSRLLALVRGRHLDRELEAEIRAHLELAERDARGRGLTPDEARRDARLRFGSVEAIKEDQRDVRRARGLDLIWRDIRSARRRLAASPVFVFAAVTTLAVGAGANALAFSALRGMLFGPLSIADADRVVWIQPRDDRGIGADASGVAGPEVRTLAARTDLFDGLAVIGSRARILARGDRRAEWKGLWVTPRLSTVLAITPAAGRAFNDDDLQANAAAPAMMIGHARWLADFGGDSAIIGRTLRFEDNKPHLVIGVLPRGLAFPEGRAPAPGTGTEFTPGEQDFWILAQSAADDPPGGTVVARLQPEVTVPRVNVVIAGLALADAAGGGDPGNRVLEAITLRNHALGAMSRGLPLLQAFAALALLIAGANLANLLLARSLTMRTEFALRAALGAERQDLVRVVAAECLWIGGTAAAGGLVLAWIGQQALTIVAAGHLAFVDRVSIDATVVAISIAGCLAVMFVCAVVPAIVTPVRATAMIDRDRPSQSASPRVSRALNVLIVVQMAIALTLLTGAGLVLRSMARLLNVDTGYEASRVVAADVLLFEPPAQVVPFFVNLHERLRRLPGVEAVGLIQSTPLTGKWTFGERVVVEGGPAVGQDTVDVPGSFVAFDYFEAMGIPIIAGRAFTRLEYTTGESTAIVINDVAANRFFPGQPAVGRRVRMFGRSREIVGVVKGTRDVRLDAPVGPQWYEPVFVGGSQVVIRTAGDSAGFVESIRRELLASDPRLIVRRVEPLDAVVSASVFERRFAMRLLTTVAALALVHAVVGLYGVSTFRTLQRRREFGVRLALGSTRGALVGLVFKEGAALAATGIVIGIVVAVPLSRAVEALLFEVAPGDVATIAVVSIALLLAALAACALPAWRAGSTDPLTIIR